MQIRSQSMRTAIVWGWGSIEMEGAWVPEDFRVEPPFSSGQLIKPLSSYAGHCYFGILPLSVKPKAYWYKVLLQTSPGRTLWDKRTILWTLYIGAKLCFLYSYHCNIAESPLQNTRLWETQSLKQGPITKGTEARAEDSQQTKFIKKQWCLGLYSRWEPILKNRWVSQRGG